MATHAPSTCESQRPQLNLRFLLTALTIAALWLSLFWVTSIASKVLLAIYGLTYLFGCWKTRRAVLMLLPAMYVPYAWLLDDWPWSEYQRQWIAIVWHLPGILAEVATHPSGKVVLAVVTSLATLVVFFCSIFAARRSLRSAWITCLVVCLASAANSLLSYALFRG